MARLVVNDPGAFKGSFGASGKGTKLGVIPRSHYRSHRAYFSPVTTLEIKRPSVSLIFRTPRRREDVCPAFSFH